MSDRDLYATALALRSIEIAAEPGEHTVTVSYDGGLRARVDLEIERWGATATATATAGAPGGPRELTLGRELPTRVAPGAALQASYVVRSGREIGAVVLVQPLSPAFTVDREELTRMRASGDVLDYSLSADEVRIVLAPGERRAFELPFWATREGEVTLAPATARSEWHSSATATSGSNVVRIGR